MAQDPLTKYRAVVIGGSAGSLEVILDFVGALPVDAGVFYIIILHRKNDADSILSDLIAARTSMPVKETEDKDIINKNSIYLAPPDYHLLIEDGQTFSLDSSEKIHFSRPAIDVTFESVAVVFGRTAIGVLLSGANADGAAGLKLLYEAGAVTLVQSPETAEVDYMPKQALARCAGHRRVAADEMGQAIAKLITGE